MRQVFVDSRFMAEGPPVTFIMVLVMIALGLVLMGTMLVIFAEPIGRFFGRLLPRKGRKCSLATTRANTPGSE